MFKQCRTGDFFQGLTLQRFITMSSSSPTPPGSEEPHRRHAPATLRNREPILAVLSQVLPPTGTVLEIASGTGEHAAFFAPRLAPRFWQPSDVDPGALRSISAWQNAEPTAHGLPPCRLDVLEPHWPQAINPLTAPVTAIVAINLIHIAPWEACLGLLAGAGELLPAEGMLYLYGPFKRCGEPMAPSNAAFDADLRSRHPQWGIRDLDDVADAAKAAGLVWLGSIAMPANNRSVILARRAVPACAAMS